MTRRVEGCGAKGWFWMKLQVTSGLTAAAGMVLIQLVWWYTPTLVPPNWWQSVSWLVSSGCVCCYWGLQLSDRLEAEPSWLRLGLPRLVYLLAALHVPLTYLGQTHGEPQPTSPRGPGEGHHAAASISSRRSRSQHDHDPKRWAAMLHKNRETALFERGLVNEDEGMRMKGGLLASMAASILPVPSGVGAMIPTWCLLFGAGSCLPFACCLLELRLLLTAGSHFPAAPHTQPPASSLVSCHPLTSFVWQIQHPPLLVFSLTTHML